MINLLITGYPGWLANSLLDSLLNSKVNSFKCITLFLENKFNNNYYKDYYIGNLPIRYRFGNLNDKSSLLRALDGIDVILHAAGILHVKRTTDWYTVNTVGTENLIHCASELGSVNRFVYISSNAAMGKSSGRTLLTEAMLPVPLSHYGKSKLLAENIVRKYGNKMETVILRPCMFYGPPVPARHIEIYKRIINGRMPIVGNGNYLRSLTHVNNLVQGCKLALLKQEAADNTFIIADEKCYSTLDVIKAMYNSLEVEFKYIKIPEVTATTAYFIDRLITDLGFYIKNIHLLGESNWNVGVSVKKAKEVLGYNPTVDLQMGMNQSVKWCRDNNMI